MLFDEIMTNEMIQMNVIAATDASGKDRKMEGAQTITNAQGDVLVNRTYHEIWNNNSNMTAEALTLLELIKAIEQKSRNTNGGRIETNLDCRQAQKKIVKNVVKPNHVVGDTGSEIAAIKKSISRMAISIEFKLNKGHPRKQPTLRNNPTQWLLCACGRNAKDTSCKIEERNRTPNVKFYADNALMKVEVIESRYVKDVVRIQDVSDE